MGAKVVGMQKYNVKIAILPLALALALRPQNCGHGLEGPGLGLGLGLEGPRFGLDLDLQSPGLLTSLKTDHAKVLKRMRLNLCVRLILTEQYVPMC